MSDAVKLERMRRKQEKTLQQRDHWKAKHDELRKFLEMFPFYERERVRIVEYRLERERVKSLEKRVTEQAALIERLMKESP